MAAGVHEINTYFGRCRCCLKYGYLKNMWEEHYFEGMKEMYVEMLVQCFALSWEPSEDSMEHDQICQSCVLRLRDAHAFKKEVMDSQEMLLAEQADESETIIKQEVDYTMDSDDIGSEFQNDPDDADESEYRKQHDTKYEDDELDGPKREVLSDNQDTEYEDVEYLEDEISEQVLEDPKSTERRTKSTSKIPPGRKWPQKLPKSERYKTYKQYTEEDLRKALAAVKKEKLTLQEASKKFNIPAKTLCAKAKVDVADAPRNKSAAQKMMKYKFKETVRIILENSTATPIKGHWGIGYACCYCAYQNASPTALQQHTLTTHSVDDILFKSLKSHVDLIIKLDITGLKCKICDEKFSELDKFIDHLNAHGKNVHIDIKNYIIPFKFETEYLKCALCEHQCGTFKFLTEHMSLHYRNYECDLCGRGFISKRALKSHLMRHKTGIFKCTQCGKIFDSKIKMKEHERVVHVLLMKTRKCGYCDEKFMDVVQKITHEVQIHGAPVPVYQCKACDKKFDTARSLKEHTNRTHLMLRPHTCSFCDMGFYNKTGLKRHLVKHTGVKEYECHVCNKMYSSKKSLGIHLRIHLDDRRFNCERCGQAFVQQSSLSYHLRTKHRD